MKAHIHRPAHAADRAPVHVPPRGLVAAPQTVGTGAGHDFGRVSVFAPAVGAGPIQRLDRLSGFARTLDKGDPTQAAHLKAVRTHLGAYHKLNRKAPQERVAALNQLHRSIYGWFDAVKGPGAFTGRKPANEAQMRKLLAQVDDEHVKRVRDVRADPRAVPFSTEGMGWREARAAHGTWRSLVTGTGNLSVQGDDEFKDRTYSQLAKLMEQPTGRKLVSRLDQKHWWGNRTVTVGPTFAGHPALKGNAETNDSYAQPVAGDKRETLRPESPITKRDSAWGRVGYGFPVVGPGEGMAKQLQDAVMGGYSGVQVQGEQGARRVGAGSDAVVRMLPPDPGKVHLGPAEEDVLTPSFVTLGHELGHAHRITRGAAMQGLDLPTEALNQLSAPGGARGESATEMWSNPEEYVNITQVENPIRQEHGVSKRAFHRDARQLEKLRKGRALATPIRARLKEAEPRIMKLLPHLNEDHMDVRNGILDRHTDLEKRVQVGYHGGDFSPRDASTLQGQVAAFHEHLTRLSREHLPPVVISSGRSHDSALGDDVDDEKHATH